MGKESDKVIEALFRELYSQFVTYACHILQDRALAEEAVQETFRIACCKSNELMSSQNRKGWLMNTLKNVLRNMQRSRASLSALVVDSMALMEDRRAAASQDEIDVDLLYEDISNTEEYLLLKKIALEKYTILDAAKELGISVEACKKRVQRARKFLQKKLKNLK